ncbi:AMP-binding protein [[Mycobacterium] burgundiense]|uniref:AMP-binding protein n=1 Tax=[Mycobacterium] burgundiense TaxID=3064286 RepID=A0ABM9LTC2_9MYCO|nr:AMP-binding protein [Mycolicibacterium sp. MU0053]CAJ1504369.1 AMP-binding protein [Mycolicibacterium sp. MU0053]
MIQASLPAVLRERASLQPNDIAFTFMDYEQDWDGVPITLTWAQLYRRTLNLSQELAEHAEPGDRAVILAPQSLDYIVAFVAALQAGLIAVPLPAPAPGGGAHDERTAAVVVDTEPSVVLTTSAVREGAAGYAMARDGQPAPTVIEVDLLDLDSRRRSGRRVAPQELAYLQYTSGSTRRPAGVEISHANLAANFKQMMGAFFSEHGGVAPPDTTFVSWLPFYHDMGLMLGMCVPILGGVHTVVTSPMAFLQRPARWMQLVASHPRALSAGPNFAYELAAGRTTDDDMAGLDLSNVMNLLSGAERVHAATVRRFAERFAAFGLRENKIRPSYGLAEAVVYVATRASLDPLAVVEFDAEKLSAGHAQRCGAGSGSPLVSYGRTDSPVVRVVDPDTAVECADGRTGEIWVRGDNVALGYWQKPDETRETFGATIVNPSAETPAGPWLRTGDLGFFSEGELFIMGRIKDLLIVYGRNHSPDDIEATVQEISRGRAAAISVPDDRTEHLVVIVEHKKRGDTEEAAMLRLADLKRELTSAISTVHGLKVADLVMVGPGAIPITTSGKVRRASCVEQYRHGQFARLDA